MKIGIIRFPGSNCDNDTYNFFKDDNEVFYIEHSDTEYVYMDLMIIPGGFSYADRLYKKATGDYTMAPGEMALKSNVIKIINEAYRQGVKILGICNGLQILIKMNLLPGFDFEINDNKKFISKMVNCSVKLNNIHTDFSLYIANKYGHNYSK